MPGNSFVFGAYTHCSWPAAIDVVVSDPTGKSFHFSLFNASGKAAHFSLHSKDRAIQVSDGIGFGGDKFEGGKATGFPNFILMYKGRSADQQDGNCANSANGIKAYRTDTKSARDLNFLAGREFFAAAEIEVFQL